MVKNSAKEVSKESLDIPEEKMVELYNLFPEIFSEGKIDFDKLKETLGEEIDTRDEKYSFNWNGRKEALKNIQTTSKGTLVPAKNESVKFDSTENLFIEGDNLEVLKLLQKSYFNKVKMIYIDPPYNTGKDFVYKDDFKNSIKAYLEQTGQVDGDGIKLTSNPETSGRFHSDWITMMYPRLFVARNLLREDGVIFVSIDDNEVHNLRMIMNEIFGEENFVAEIVWRKTDNQANIGKIARVKEYIICYSKNIEKVKLNKMELTERAIKEYRYSDEKGQFRRAILLHKTRGRHNFTIETPSGKKLKGPWMIKEPDFMNLDKSGGIYWTHGGDEQPYGKIYLNESGGQISSDLLGIEFGTNQEASLQLESLLGDRYFDFPKPVSLIKHFVIIGSNQDDIILDFFAGSGTTGHSALELNKEQDSKRKFILVQLPELTDKDSKAYKAGFKTISDIAKERIRKAIKLLESKEGFKVFKLSQSNYKIWDKYEGKSDKELKKQLELFKTPLVTGYKEENVIYECIIKEGYSLNSNITKIEIKTNKVYKVTDSESFFYICLDPEIKDKTLDELKLKKEDMLICLDEGLSDSKKKNLSIQCNLKVI